MTSRDIAGIEREPDAGDRLAESPHYRTLDLACRQAQRDSKAAEPIFLTLELFPVVERIN